MCRILKLDTDESDFSFSSRPTFSCDWRCKSVPLSSSHGLARPQKVTSHNSTVGGRGKLVLYHHQLPAAGQEPTLPRRNW